MKELADGVWQLHGKPENSINVYLLGDVLIDSGVAFNRSNILEELAGREVAAHAITHAHFDHFGASHAVCKALGLPLWVGELDVAAVEAGKQAGRLPRFGEKLLPAAKGHPVAKALKEGDEVAGFQVLFTPGHSPGHVSFWREADRVLVCGDVMWGVNPFTGRRGVREPFAPLCTDPRSNRESARRLAALNPELVLFGHGPALRDPAAFAAAVGKLPS
ncbi:MAG: MBL fold metallo-hydrolase [Solirubrobacteraceae bacterium]|nr:MBL fold metallo-hydrolase [Solirubrobacteraceae bacterium]